MTKESTRPLSPTSGMTDDRYWQDPVHSTVSVVVSVHLWPGVPLPLTPILLPGRPPPRPVRLQGKPLPERPDPSLCTTTCPHRGVGRFVGSDGPGTGVGRLPYGSGGHLTARSLPWTRGPREWGTLFIFRRYGSPVFVVSYLFSHSGSTRDPPSHSFNRSESERQLHRSETFCHLKPLVRVLVGSG